MASAHSLPFDLPRLSRGYAALGEGARRRGARAASGAAASVAAIMGFEGLTGRDVAISGRASPGSPSPLASAARLSLSFAAVPAVGALELEPGLVAGIADLLAGGDGRVPGATTLTPVETAVLELLALAALDGACAAGLEAPLAPRLLRAGAAPSSPLAVELEIAAGPVRGRGRLLVDPAAVRALEDAPSPDAGPPASAVEGLRVPLGWRRSTASLSPEELAALAPGDVVLLDAGDGREALVLPGGARAWGTTAEEGFHVEELERSRRTAQLPIVLEVELGRVEVTLAELGALAPGGILPLRLDRRGRVTLRAGERAVADAELVDVDGAVGVRIVSLEVAP